MPKILQPRESAPNALFGSCLGTNTDGSFVTVGNHSKTNANGQYGEVTYYNLNSTSENFEMVDFKPSGEVFQSYQQQILGPDQLARIPVMSGAEINALSIGSSSITPEYQARAIDINGDTGYSVSTATRSIEVTGFPDPTTRIAGFGIASLPNQDDFDLGVETREIFQTYDEVNAAWFAINDSSITISSSERFLAVTSQYHSVNEDDTVNNSIIIFSDDAPDPEGRGYSQIQTLDEINNGTTEQRYFGRSIEFDQAAETLFVGYPNLSRTESDGEVRVYKRDPAETDFVLAQTIPAQEIVDGSGFGAEISISLDGTLLAVAAGGADGPLGESKWGAIFLYRKDLSGVYVYDGKIHPSITSEGTLYGVSLSEIGDRIVIGAQDMFVEVLDYDGANWTSQVVINSPEDNIVFGNPLHLSGDGNVLAVTAREATTLIGGLNSGAVYVYNLNDEFALPFGK